jgi:hypothetical protein
VGAVLLAAAPVTYAASPAERSAAIAAIPCANLNGQGMRRALDSHMEREGGRGNPIVVEPTKAFGLDLTEFTKSDWQSLDDRHTECVRSGAIRNDGAEMSIHERLIKAPDPDGAYAAYIQRRNQARAEQNRREEAAIMDQVVQSMPPANTTRQVDCTDGNLLASVRRTLANQYTILRLYNPRPSMFAAMMATMPANDAMPTTDAFGQRLVQSQPQCMISAVTDKGPVNFYVRVLAVDGDEFVEVKPQ